MRRPWRAKDGIWSYLGLPNSLIGQAAMIVLPVALLTGLAAYSLRMDRQEVEQAARRRAQAVAPEIARSMEERINEMMSLPEITGSIVDGGIEGDPADPPEPPDWLGLLTPAQLRLWRQAEEAPGATAGRGLWGQLASLNLPAAAKAEAEFHTLEMQGGASPVSGAKALQFAARSPLLASASGAPLADLALLYAARAYGARAPAAYFDAVKARIQKASFLTPELVRAAAGAATASGNAGRARELAEAWSAREAAFALLRQLAQSPAALRWVAAEGRSYLGVRVPTQSGTEVKLFSEAAVKKTFEDGLRQRQGVLPIWAGTAVDLGGRTWRVGVHTGGPDYAVVPGALAGAPRGFTLHIQLAAQMLLYGAPSRNSLLFGLLMAAPVSALFGLMGLWRSHQRQVRLAAMKSNFVSSVSHELRAPIAAVRLMAESLETGRVEGEAKQREYFRLISQECRRLSSLVENVLDFSRIEQGRRQFHFEPLDLAALLRQSVTLMEPYAAERQIQIELAEPSGRALELEPCWDHQAVEQMLVNLIDNAVKHSPVGGKVAVSVETAECVGHPPILRLWVEDWGEGIPPGEHERIFDLFYRHGSELRRETKGVGIGLHIVKHIAEAHGGRVIVESAVGQGSRFGLELPVIPPAAQEVS
jgi:signal transduction histidine kinase